LQAAHQCFDLVFRSDHIHAPKTGFRMMKR
jgi:hypothetical protein